MQLRISNLTHKHYNMTSEIVLFVWTNYNKDHWFKEFQHASTVSTQIVSENGLRLKPKKMNRDVLSAIKF